jgi:hypothetical protein
MIDDTFFNGSKITTQYDEKQHGGNQNYTYADHAPTICGSMTGF